MLHQINIQEMKNNNLLRYATGGFILFSALSLSSVSLKAFINPQSVMDLVQVTLPNNDAYSSIRGIYGGVGATIVIALVYLCYYNHQHGLVFLMMFWGFYALSRAITHFYDGALGAFGKQWIITETVLFIIALLLYVFNQRSNAWRIAVK